MREELTLDEIADAYAISAANRIHRDVANRPRDKAKAKRDVDAWFVAEIRKAKADAWDEGASTGAAYGDIAIELNPMHRNPYRDAPS